MTEPEQQHKMYSHLIAISHEALERKFYETAYHALAAAMHYAQSTGELESLEYVQQTATAQQNLIDAQAPLHWMSRQESAKRRVTSLYDTLAQQAGTRVLLVRHNSRKNTKLQPRFGNPFG